MPAYWHKRSILLCDLDYFKQINDTQGHDAGDIALQAVSHAIVGAVRETDSAYRWGVMCSLCLLRLMG